MGHSADFAAFFLAVGSDLEFPLLLCLWPSYEWPRAADQTPHSAPPGQNVCIHSFP